METQASPLHRHSLRAGGLFLVALGFAASNLRLGLANLDTVAKAGDAKQGLLDLRSENARLRLVTRLFRAAARRLDFVERAQARARSNGKVRFG